MAELAVDSVNSSTCAALKEVNSHEFKHQNSTVVVEQLKEVQMELRSAQWIIKLLQEELNKNPEAGNIGQPSVGVREYSAENNHGDWNLVN
jgi:hypothetical protein